MTDRATFLAAVRSTPRGDDPGQPDRLHAPDAPTELRDGEDRFDRLLHECALNSTVVHRVPEDSVAATILAILDEADAQSVALTEDLGARRQALTDACAAAGRDAAAYADVAPNRARAGALDATITGCAAAVAATGSIITSAAGAGRAGALIAPTHICVVDRDQVVTGLHELFDGSVLADVGSLLALQSGPSRSADIEKVLILGVHGPGNVHLVLVDG
ncbi:MAG: LUD domain-containing protein [Actinobacteria bacterium]|nr:LUD domain-containing protein [Actinomycetota bacterium]